MPFKWNSAYWDQPENGACLVVLAFADDLFRFGAIGNLLWVCFLAPRNQSKLAHAYITIPSMVCSIFFLITTAYDEVALFGFFGYVVAFGSRLVIVLSWLFTINVLSDNFKLGPFYLTIVGIYVIRALAFQLDLVPPDLFALISHIMRAALYVFLIYKVLSELSGDLLEKRRQFRIWFMLGHLLIPIGFTLERVFISDTQYVDYASILESLSIFLMSGFLLYHSVRPEDIYPFEADESDSAEGTADSAVSKESSTLLAADKHSLDILQGKMQKGLYREPGLTVAELAKTIDIQEHRLRKLINSHLGYRNISQYLNDYRIAEAKKRLTDVKDRHSQILTIAMDAGYVSLRPFNRAFKNRTGQTPSQYREQHLGAQPNLSGNT